jgi:hypothetical protein
VVSATDPHGRNLGFLDPDTLYNKCIISTSKNIVVNKTPLLGNDREKAAIHQLSLSNGFAHKFVPTATTELRQ